MPEDLAREAIEDRPAEGEVFTETRIDGLVHG
jgi:hypothetical protein